MTRVSEIMTRSLASCSPDTSVREAARIMDERNIGDILVMNEGKLLGIVTDRDLATRALTDDNDARHNPVRNYMTTPVIEGRPDWSIAQVAGVMADHQVRRLPITADGQVVGIVSLGDVALSAPRQNSTAKALAQISLPMKVHSNRSLGIGARIMLLASAAAAVAAWMSMTKSGARIRKQVSHTGFDAASVLDSMKDKLDDVPTREQAEELIGRWRDQLSELATHIPDGRFKPKRRRFWFA